MSRGLQVVAWRLDEPDAAVEPRRSILSPEERRRADAFTRDSPRRRFIVARCRLREWLGERLGIAPSAIDFAYGSAGKPALLNDPSVHFNLAHSADLAVCAIAEYPVGVDVERRRPMKNAHGLAKRWFHPAEQRRIAAASDPLDAFFRTWTSKEAALKLVGVGVGESLPKVLTPGEPAGGTATGLPDNALGLRTCRVEPLPIAPGFVAAIATPGEDRSA